MVDVVRSAVGRRARVIGRSFGSGLSAPRTAVPARVERRRVGARVGRTMVGKTGGRRRTVVPKGSAMQLQCGRKLSAMTGVGSVDSAIVFSLVACKIWWPALKGPVRGKGVRGGPRGYLGCG